MTLITTADKEKIVKRWEAAFKDYPSPSASNLITYAKEIVPEFPDDEDTLFDCLCKPGSVSQILHAYLGQA